jgi:Amidohydrolase
MKKDDVILVSVDDHIVEPPDMFDGFIPAKYADRAPQFVSDDIGEKGIFGEGEARNVGLNAVAGRPPEEYGLEPSALDEIRRGCYDVHERVKDMDANGVLGSLNFPSMARFCGQFFATRVTQDPDLVLAVLRAYNDWHLDAWCSAYPDRFIPCTIPPIWDPDLMAEEIHRTAAKGSHCVSFSAGPHGLGWPSLHSDHWDPFWAACVDTGTVVTMHIGSGAIGGNTAQDAWAAAASWSPDSRDRLRFWRHFPPSGVPFLTPKRRKRVRAGLRGDSSSRGRRSGRAPRARGRRPSRGSG